MANPTQENKTAQAGRNTTRSADDDPFEMLDQDDLSGIGAPRDLDFILDIPLQISVELGRTRLLVSDLLKLGQGSVIELSNLAGDALAILANEKLIAKGEVVVVNEKYGIRITEIVSPKERIERLK
ncbi:flagellar motor switch protein FliN [Desulfococcus sp.]|uniref:flagellar motor switch protein FliN n=1 Tax=Desulfococcus sp. TaxID=2025834 RepID=UPI0035934F20